MMERLIEIALTNAASAAVLAMAAAAAERYLRRPGVVHALWVLVLLRLLTPPIFELGLAPAPPVAPPLTAAQAGSGLGFTAAPSGLATSPAITAQEVAVLVWLVGAAAVLGFAVTRTVRFRTLVASAEPAGPGLRSRVAVVAAAMGIGRPPPARVVRAPVPPLLGARVGRPELIVPAVLLEQLSSSECDTLIAHELAHLRRRDHWVRFLELAAVVLFWWHPAAWWACRRLRRAEERSCDALVAQILPGHARAYADCLLKTMHYLSGAAAARCAVASGAGEAHDLKERLTLIMTRQLPKSLSRPMRVALILAALALLAVFPTRDTGARSGDPVTAADPQLSAEPIDLDVKDVRLIEALMSLVESSELNFVIQPGTDVHTKVTAELVQIPWNQAFAKLLRDNDLDFSVERNVVLIYEVGSSWGQERDVSFAGEPITLNLHHTDLRKTLKSFSQYSDYEVAPDGGIEGMVTLELKDVPWDQALDLILRLQGLEMTQEGNVLRVHAPKPTP